MINNNCIFSRKKIKVAHIIISITGKIGRIFLYLYITSPRVSPHTIAHLFSSKRYTANQLLIKFLFGALVNPFKFYHCHVVTTEILKHINCQQTHGFPKFKHIMKVKHATKMWANIIQVLMAGWLGSQIYMQMPYES